jgi:hypothetical protein
MLYDTAAGPPRPGSLLESVFILMSKTRQEAEYFKTKALVVANFAAQVEGGGKMLEEAMDRYRRAIFPFLAEEKKKLDVDSKELLKHWTNKMFKVQPLWRASDNKGVVSKMRKGADKVKQAEDLRRKQPHKRI